MTYFLVYPFVYLVFRIAASLLGGFRVTGRENVPASGGLIYCPNHQSDSDPAFMLISIPRKAWFVGKEELFSIRYASWLFRAMRGIPIKRDSADRAALRRVEQLLQQGNPVLIFPEGRLSETGELGTVQPGAPMLALRAGVPIVPVGIHYTNQVVPYGSLRPRRSVHPVTIDFGKPIHPSEFDHLPKKERIDALTERLRSDLVRLSG